DEAPRATARVGSFAGGGLAPRTLQLLPRRLPIGERAQPLVDRLPKILAQERAIDVALVAIDDRVGRGARYQFHAEFATHCFRTAREGGKRRIRRAPLELGDGRLRHSGAFGKLLLGQTGLLPSLPEEAMRSS